MIHDGSKENARPAARWWTRVVTPPALRLGIFLSETSFTAVVTRRRFRGARPDVVLHESVPEGFYAEAVENFFGEIRERWPERAIVADVALARPLAQVKTLPLPTLSRGGIRKMIEQGARRFFFNASEALLTDAVRVRRMKRGEPSPAVITATSERIVTALLAAAESAGVTVERVVPAPIAFVRSSLVLYPRLRKGDAAVAVCLPDAVEVALLRRGHLVALRGRRRAVPEGANVDSLGGLTVLLDEMTQGHALHAPTVALLGAGGAGELDGTSAFSAASGDAYPIHSIAPSLSGEALSAWGAGLVSTDTTILLPEPRRRALRRRELHRSGVLAVGMLVLLGGAARMHLQMQRRRLEEIRHMRDILRPTLVRAERIGHDLSGVRTRTAVLHRLDSTSLSWTGIIAALTGVLPADTYLSTLQAEGVHIRLEGITSSAAALAARLDSSVWVDSVNLSPAQRLDTPAGPRERFQISLTFVQPTARRSIQGIGPDTSGPALVGVQQP